MKEKFVMAIIRYNAAKFKDFELILSVIKICNKNLQFIFYRKSQ